MRFIGRLWLCWILLWGVAAQAQEQPRQLQQIIDSGELRIGVSLFTPWTMKTEQGELYGSEIDMGERLAEDMGLKPAFTVYEWKDLIGALRSGAVDVIVAGMAITPERALRVNFSQPYAVSGVGLVANTEATKNIDSLAALNREKVAIGVVKSTVDEEVARRLFDKAAIKTFPTAEQAAKAVVNGLVHVQVASNPAPQFLALEHPGKVDLPLDKPLMETREAFAIRKGDADLLAYLNAWIEAHQADAWIPTTRRYWFETLDWRDAVKQ